MSIVTRGGMVKFLHCRNRRFDLEEELSYNRVPSIRDHPSEKSSLLLRMAGVIRKEEKALLCGFLACGFLAWAISVYRLFNRIAPVRLCEMIYAHLFVALI